MGCLTGDSYIAESFASQVLYLPVSATGRSPERDPKTGALGFRPKDVKPVLVEVPLLYSMSRWMHGLVPYRKQSRVPKIPPGPHSDSTRENPSMEATSDRLADGKP